MDGRAGCRAKACVPCLRDVYEPRPRLMSRSATIVWARISQQLHATRDSLYECFPYAAADSAVIGNAVHHAMSGIFQSAAFVQLR